MTRSLLRAVGLCVSAAVIGTAGCSSGSHGTAPPAGTSQTSPSQLTSAPQPTGLAGGGGETSAPSTVMITPTPKLTTGAGHEIDKPCPYASTGDFREAEGDRTVRSVQLVGSPVGCRYYFELDPTVVIGEIRIQTFGTSTEAFNAVVTAARGHPEAYSDKTIGDGAVLLKLPLQGTQAWACVFAKGRRVVTAQTRQTTVAQDAKNVAVLIEARVP
jgi:hypothetical protein